MKRTNWITLDYLELFCQLNQLVIGCRRGDDEVWISPLGPHPSSLTSEEIQDILRESPRFEIRKTLHQDPDITTSHFLTRTELEQQLRRLMN